MTETDFIIQRVAARFDSDDPPETLIKQAQQLLKKMRDPESVLDCVHERIVIGRSHLQRTVTVRFVDDDALKHEPLLLDILDPTRGELVRVDGEGSSPCERLSHDEHVKVSIILIMLIVAAVNESTCRNPTPVAAFLAQLLQDLCQIPVLTTEEARGLLHKHFDEKGRLKSAPPELVCQPNLLLTLFDICSKLCERYLVLVRVLPVDGPQQRTVTFTTFEPSDERVNETQLNPSWWQRLRRPARRFMWFASTDPNFRVHIPWARRTRLYTISVDAPEGMFISSQSRFLVGNPNASDRPLVLKEASEFPWAITLQQGRQSHGQLRDGIDGTRPFYFKFHIRELPGRSTSDMAGLALVTMLVMLLVALFVPGETRPMAPELAGLILALVPIVRWGDGERYAIFGKPVLSRVSVLGISASAVVFLAWVFSRPTEPRSAESARDMLPAIQWICDSWYEYGVAVPLGICCLFFVMLWHRRHTLLREYQLVRTIGQLSGGPRHGV